MLMRCLRLLAVSLIVPLLVAAEGNAAEPPEIARQAAASAAADQIRQTHFFTAGRGMHVVPGIYRLYDWMQRPDVPVDLTGGIPALLGLNMEGRRAVGLFGVDYEGSRVGVLGCVACHSGRAAGVTHIGLGNKNIDVGMVGKIAHTVSQPYLWTRELQTPEQRPLVERSAAFARRLADDRYNNLTQGMVPVSLVHRWFFDQAGATYPPDAPRAGVKVAHLWGYGEKRKVGRFCDGFGDGRSPGWAAGVEVAAGQTPENVRGYADKMEEVEKLFEQLLPPPYPLEIDRDLAGRGQHVFAEHCAACHGSYRRDADGLPIFEPPVFVPYDDVQTDFDRLKIVDERYRSHVAASRLKDLIRPTDHPPGYIAPRLEGIWARFPYLHNTSVPHLEALLTAAKERPRVWSLRAAGESHRFDSQRVGLTVPEPGSEEATRLQERAERGDRDVFLTSRAGHSNQGHEFGTSLAPRDKAALIEYLKTL